MENSKGDNWDKAYNKLQIEAIEADKQYTRDITDAAICGRLSILVQADKALEAGVSLEQFIVATYHTVAQEMVSGKIDTNSFELPTSLDDKI